MSSFLSLSHMNKTFEAGTPNAKLVISDFSLELNKGDFLTILGSNGSGKTTLFNAILGYFEVDSGRIILDGEDITRKKDYLRAKDIRCLYQNPLRGTSPNLTIEENLALAFPDKENKSIFAVNRKNNGYFRELLSRLGLGLEERMKTKMGLLSGGQRQAASLLMATIAKPKLLLLDEHTAALDPVTALAVLKITDEVIAEEGITTMMITHDINYALAHGNRTIMMDSGKIVLDISGSIRSEMTPERLLELFAEKVNAGLSDRMLLSTR
jgi:putative ABC transport system ATP-binding protein